MDLREIGFANVERLPQQMPPDIPCPAPDPAVTRIAGEQDTGKRPERVVPIRPRYGTTPLSRPVSPSRCSWK